jgi:hypothetical protein
MKRAEQSVIGSERQASSAEQSVNGAELEVLNTEKSMVDTRARKCLRTERSVDRHGASSSRTRGSPIRAICEDRSEGGGEVRNAEGGAIRSMRGTPASKAEQSASGAKLSALSTEQSDAQRERKLQASMEVIER